MTRSKKQEMRESAAEAEFARRVQGTAGATIANCTCANLRKAARAVTQYYDSVLKASGLKGTQFSLLGAAAAAGPVSLGRLAERLVMDRTTLTRNLKPLAAAGLVRIEAGEDKRARLVRLTPAGRERLAKALPLWREAQAGMVERLGEDQVNDLIRGLRAAVAAARG